ncbi:hypothetical protein AB0C34_07605 [Nocardia sp. NPDC049220]|uniref:hypothetical protein n=1 Tax=Nocardia sp. NPDC049220 TaxID=3155273 RepID=UPI00340425D6
MVNNEPIGIRHNHIDGTFEIIGADGWPLSPEETAELFQTDDDGDSLEVLERVRDTPHVFSRKADRAQ